MKEAWCLWGLKSGTCPVCVANKDQFNLRNTSFDRRPSFRLGDALDHYEKLRTKELKLAYTKQLHQSNGHFPVRLAFSGLAPSAFRAYICDLLHQPKKGIFSNLLECLEHKAKADGVYQELRRRMALIPRYDKMEHFNRNWFDVSKITASNYRDMVSNP